MYRLEDIPEAGAQLVFEHSRYVCVPEASSPTLIASRDPTLHEVATFYVVSKLQLSPALSCLVTVLYYALVCIASACFIALGAQLAFTLKVDKAVPVTCQTLAVLLVAAATGPLLAFASVLVYLLLGIALPFYAGHSHGFGHLDGCTSGYLWGFLLTALFVVQPEPLPTRC